ncbi:MAG: type 1 glutamine amidotransferase-like domain-containing protein [bacterium]|nr:type 1 glutamine amidotransferase-like domain-containing protein [bacterium]
MRIALAGGGNEQDSAHIDQCFREWLGPKGSLLYIPIALNWPAAKYATAYRWLCEVFRPSGALNIHMWTNLEDHDSNEIFDYAGIYIGGGNTYLLLDSLRRTGLDSAITEFARDNRPVYGGSAGAAVLGKSIETIDHIDVNEVGLTDMTGLDLLRGHSVWVHYEEQHRELAESYSESHDEDLVVLTERTGVAFEDGEFRSVGHEPASVVDRDGWRILPGRSPGE